MSEATAAGEQPSSEFDVGHAIDSAPFSRFHVEVILLCGLIAMLDGFDTQAIAFVAPILLQEWSLDKGTFAMIFGAGLVGIMVGQFVFGPISDRFGRRLVITICTLFFGALTLATAWAQTPEQLLVLRFLTGIGLGGATPNIIALTSEFSPARSRATMITIMFAGFPFGAAVGGYISSLIIPQFGWQSVFVFGGVVPIALALIIVSRLPESIQQMVMTGAAPDKVREGLKRVRSDVTIPENAAFMMPERTLKGLSFVHLFRDGRAMKTLLIWAAFFMSLLMIYFLFSWLPSALNEVGLSLSAAINMAVMLNVGGAIGGIVLGRLIDRGDAFLILALAYFVAGICIASIGYSTFSMAILMSVVFGAGFLLVGGQTALNAATTAVYPTQVRSTGVGAALGVGRTGSIFGPVMGAYLLDGNWSTSALFMAAAAPAFVAFIALFLVRSMLKERTQ